MVSSIQGLSQEVVTLTYDLDQRKFLDPKIKPSYKKDNIVNGVLSIGGKSVEVIRLRVVRKWNDRELKKKSKNEGELASYLIESDQVKADSTFLISVQTLLSNSASSDDDLKAKSVESARRKFNDLSKTLNAATLDRIKIQAALTKAVEKTNKKLKGIRGDIKSRKDIIKELTGEKEVFNDTYFNTSANNTFAFSIGKLEMSEDYDFHFHWYSKNTSTAPIDSLKKRMDEIVENLLNATNSATDDTVRMLLGSEVDKINSEIFKNVYFVDSVDRSKDQKVKFADTLLKKFVNLYLDYQHVRDELQEFNNQIPEQQNLLLSLVNSPATLGNMLKPDQKTHISGLVLGELAFNETSLKDTLEIHSGLSVATLVTKYKSLESEIDNRVNSQIEIDISTELNRLGSSGIDNDPQEALELRNLLNKPNQYDQAKFDTWITNKGISGANKTTLIASYQDLGTFYNDSKALLSEIMAFEVETLNVSPAQAATFQDLITNPASYNLATFSVLVGAYRNTNVIQDRYADLKELRDEVPELEKELKEIKEEIDKLFDFLSYTYTRDGSVTSLGVASSENSTDVEGIRLSTTYGLAAIPLQDDFKVMEWAQFITMNIRWGDFDNELKGKDAFKNGLSRWSVAIGLLVTDDLQFNGQDLENTRLGFKPVIGINYQPMQHLTLGSGIVSFIPSSINNGPTRTTVRPYLSLSFDFNLFNYLIQKNSK